MDEDETWHAGRPRPLTHCVRWGPSSPPTRGHSPPNFRPISVVAKWLHFSAWIKMPLGIEVGLGTGDFVLDGDPAPLPKKGRSPQIFGPCLLWPNGWMDQDGTWHGSRPQSRRLGVEVGLSLGDFVLDGDPAPSPKGAEPPPQFSAHFYCCQTAGCIKMPLGMEVGLSPVDFMLDGDPAPSPQKGGASQFSAHVYCC